MNQLLICLYFLREGERRECLVYDHLSFHELLNILQVNDSDNRLITEKTSGYLCDPNVSLQSLGVKNCMRFHVY